MRKKIKQFLAEYSAMMLYTSVLVNLFPISTWQFWMLTFIFIMFESLRANSIRKHSLDQIDTIIYNLVEENRSK